MTRSVPLSEAQIQQHVVKLLEAYARRDICWWHVPNGELRNHKVGAKLKLAGVRAGVADLNAVIAGRFHAVELKTEIGTLSAKQLTFREDIERAGGIFHVAFGLRQAVDVLLQIGAFCADAPLPVVSTAADGRGVRRRPWEAAANQAGTRAHLTPSERAHTAQGNQFTRETVAPA